MRSNAEGGPDWGRLRAGVAAVLLPVVLYIPVAIGAQRAMRFVATEGLGQGGADQIAFQSLVALAVCCGIGVLCLKRAAPAHYQPIAFLYVPAMICALFYISLAVAAMHGRTL